MLLKENFYCKIENTADESVEVYIGQSAGKQLNKDILNAKKEVLIISPYIDESKIDDLIHLNNNGVNVQIAFSDLRQKQKSRILKKLITQHRNTDESVKDKVSKKIKLFNILSIASLFIGTTLLIYAGLTFKEFNVSLIILLLLSVAGVIGFQLFKNEKKKIAKTTVYSYDYNKNIHFKYLRNNFKEYNKQFIHSKIYVIDRKVAYLGSLNYTNNGFTTNFETRVRITQSEKVDELVGFVQHVFNDDFAFQPHEMSFIVNGIYDEILY